MKICCHRSLEVALGNPRRPIGIMSERVSTFVNCVLCLSSGSLACTGMEKQPGLVFAVLLSKQSGSIQAIREQIFSFCLMTVDKLMNIQSLNILLCKNICTTYHV